MSGHRPSTSLQRTYRYLHLAIAGAVFVVFTAILLAMPTVGLLPSLSHYYYTPAGPLFVGALIAVSVCFFALSGRGVERVLLNVAAVIVPIVAVVPTMISPRSVPGIDAGCLDGARACVPEGFAAVALVDALAPASPRAPRWLRGAYVAIAVALGLVVAGMPVYGELHTGPVYGVFVGEVIALLLFATFWILQSVQYWRAEDPAIFARE